MGVKPNYVAKLVGHSIKTMEKHYENIQLKNLEPELVQIRKKKLEQADFLTYDLELGDWSAITHHWQQESPLEALQDALEDPWKDLLGVSMPNDPYSPSASISFVRRPRKKFREFF